MRGGLALWLIMIGIGSLVQVVFLDMPCAAQGNLNPPLNPESIESPPLADVDQPAKSSSKPNQPPLGSHSILRFRNPEQSPSAAEQQLPNSTFNGSESLDRILTQLVLEHMPHHYVDDKKWGAQKKRWNGIRLRRDSDGGRLETERKFKMVNHGKWTKYSASLIDPNQEFTVELKNMSSLNNGATRFDLHFSAHLKLDARGSKWVNGLQLYSLSAEGHARIRLQVTCEMDVSLDIARFPPDLIFSPKVTDADIIVDEFRLDRISKAGGEFAQQATRGARKVLDEKIDEKEKKLVTKLNQKLEKRKDRLRLSIADAIQSKWYNKTKEFLPNNVRDALGSASH